MPQLIEGHTYPRPTFCFKSGEGCTSLPTLLSPSERGMRARMYIPLSVLFKEERGMWVMPESPFY
jgi:hypothetical protein